ncbi:MAG: aminotransferase class III-fold pyridoxal phosphate-dependent enzyme [Planctomycetes bacterium]|nr:aminotransferase class III-fold pyridoxal phosphate-dependent enzyme [Planctomycetota bacterium]
MSHNIPRYAITMIEGRGCELTDSTGKKYLDLFSGFGAGILGHCHEDLVAAATKQVNKLWHVGNLLHTEPQTRLAEEIAKRGFNGRSYFCHSGSDANEAAFKLARLYGQGKRYKVLSTTNSFHGRGFAAMMATGQDKVRLGYQPYLPGFSSVPYNDLPAMKAAIDDQTVAIIVEPIQGEGGINIPDDDYLPGLRKLCDEHDLLLIVDEVWTGCGRTGNWFAYQHAGIEPDMMTLGKAVGCGLALGVMCAHPRIAEFFDSEHYHGVPHATTLGGNAVTCAVSARMFEVLARDRLLGRAAKLGEKIMSDLHAMADETGVIKHVRGRGLFIGIELDPANAWFDKAADVMTRCLDRGLLIGSAQQNVLRLAPPLTVSDEQVEAGLAALESVLRGD